MKLSRQVHRNIVRKFNTLHSHGTCSFKSGDVSCGAKGKCTRECVTCEDLIRSGRCPSCKRALVGVDCKKCGSAKVFTVYHCAMHAEPVLRMIKRHALASHPWNIPKAMLAALKGEEI